MEENSEYVNSLWTGEAFGLRLSFLALLVPETSFFVETETT